MGLGELSYLELRNKMVINIVDGKRLGCICDIIFTNKGKVQGLVIPAERKFWRGANGADTIFVPWPKIIKIGEDTILIDLDGKCHDSFKEEDK